MTTAISQSLTSPVPAATAGPIVPPVNPTVLYFGSIVVDGVLQLTYELQHGDDVVLRYSDKWLNTGAPTTLVVQLPPGWNIVANDENVSWMGSAPIWVAQIVPPTIKAVVEGQKKVVESRFTLFEPSSGTRKDPAIVVRKEG